MDVQWLCTRLHERIKNGKRWICFEMIFVTGRTSQDNSGSSGINQRCFELDFWRSLNMWEDLLDCGDESYCKSPKQTDEKMYSWTLRISGFTRLCPRSDQLKLVHHMARLSSALPGSAWLCFAWLGPAQAAWLFLGWLGPTQLGLVQGRPRETMICLGY